MPASASPAGRPPLTVGRIVDAALGLARAEGLAGVSMRSVARTLGVEAMSVYYHVPSKAALMVLMANRSVSQLPDPDPNQSWDQRLVELLVQTFLVALDNPTVFPVLASVPFHPGTVPTSDDPAGAASLQLLDRVLALLEEGQVPTDRRVHAFRGLISVVVGFVVGDVDGLLPQPAVAEQRAPGRASQQYIDPPLVATMRPVLAGASPAASLRFTLDLLVRGLLVLPTPLLDSSARG